MINNYFELAKMSRPATLAFANLIFSIIQQRSEKVLMIKCNIAMILLHLLLGCFTSPLIAKEIVKENVIDTRYDLMLMGGGLAICSSMQPQHCKSPLPPNAGKTSTLLVISDAAIHRIEQAAVWTAAREGIRNDIVQLLRQLRLTTTTALSESALLAQLKQQWLLDKRSGREVLAQLSDAELDLLFDQLEVMQRDQETGQRLTERVYPELSKDIFSLQLYQTFVQQAALRKKGNKPKVLLLAASGRDPFAAVDFYIELFQKLGADAHWLPLNAAYQASVGRAGGCDLFSHHVATLQGSYQRDAVYPDLMAEQLAFCQQGEAAALAMIRQADGIFINGGNQSLTYQALKTPNGHDTPMLALIRQQMNAGQLIMAGSSAGTAVQAGGSYLGQSTVMISNGQSETAFFSAATAAPAPLPGCQWTQSCGAGLTQSSLTYQAQGGLGLFDVGILDTHFSERGREGRLLALVAQTGAHFGFGVDEATALLVKLEQGQHRRFRVAGREGVYVAERRADSGFSLGQHLKMQSHYFSRDDEFELKQQHLTVSPPAWKLPIQATTAELSKAEMPTLATSDYVWSDDSYRRLALALCQSQATIVRHTFHSQGGALQLTLQRDVKTSSWLGRYQQKDQHKVYCSYQNMGVWVQALSSLSMG